MEKILVLDMNAVIDDVERAYTLYEESDAIVTGKCLMRWGTTPEGENSTVAITM